MDKIEKFEKILNLVERARRLDFIALDAMERMNKQHIDIYNFYNKIINEKQNQKINIKEIYEDKIVPGTNVIKSTDIEKNLKDKEKEKEETDMTDHNEALRAFVETFNNQLNKIKLNPNPLPPDEEPTDESKNQPQPQLPNKDLAFIEKIKGLTGTVSDRIKAEADMLKHIQTVINETHRMSFALWKEMDEHFKKGTQNLGK